MIFRKHSLLKRVTLWCAGTLAVFSLITAAASFAIGYEEAKDRQDDILKEVVGMLSRDIVQQRQRNKIQELTLGGFYGPGSDKGETLPQYGALTMDDDVFEDHFPKIKKTHVVIEYGEPIYPNELSKEEKKKLADITLERIKEMYFKNKELV